MCPDPGLYLSCKHVSFFKRVNRYSCILKKCQQEDALWRQVFERSEVEAVQEGEETKKSESKPGREKADDQISKHGNVAAGFGDERKREEPLKGTSRPQPGLDPRLLGQGFGGTAASLGPQGIPVCCGVSGSQQRPDLRL